MPSTLMRMFTDRLTRVADHVDDPEQLPASAQTMLADIIGDERLLERKEMEPDPDHYRQHILHVDEKGRFSVVALVWLPGQETPVHDHVAWCITGVHAGHEVEKRFDVTRDTTGRPRLRPTGEFHNVAGTVTGLPPVGRDIHHVRCAGDEIAISLHLYGADIGRLGSSINVVYDPAVIMEMSRPGEPAATASRRRG
ncbi:MULTISPECIES: cysteine dioxygenase family protein [Thermocrispum]|uniref:Cysteine dioxygenase n=1 Tax=Thermocrispum agreste TaxID=37925 RepID=A0A2W4JR72_9PSEU|nr:MULTISPECIES: cysteine dioxygenase family protein [Thermocrispum]PZN00839.1 MAG: cysteine dioxygenase [Thermocrispum agreste]